MKIILRIFLIVVLIIFVVFGFYLWKVRQHELQMRKVAHVMVYFSEPIANLQSVTLNVCDSSYHYPLERLQDTVSENIGIHSEYFPCRVEVSYQFIDGSQLIHQTDSFNCAGCSGANAYLLSEDKVTYEYTP